MTLDEAIAEVKRYTKETGPLDARDFLELTDSGDLALAQDAGPTEIALAMALNAVASGELVKAGWQPIATAPRDGTVILGARRCEYMDGSPYMDGAIMMCERDRIGGNTGWAYMGIHVFMVRAEDQPTHWMPLPQPPEVTP